MDDLDRALESVMEEIEADMKDTGRGAFRPSEVPGIVQAAVRKALRREVRMAWGERSFRTQALDEAVGVPKGQRVGDDPGHGPCSHRGGMP